MLIKYGDAKVLKVVNGEDLNIDVKKVKKAIDKTKKKIKNSAKVVSGNK